MALQSGEMHQADDGCGSGPVGSGQAVDEYIPPVLDLVLDVFEDWSDEGDQLLLQSLLFRQQTKNWNTDYQRIPSELPPPGNIELVISQNPFMVVLDIVSAVHHGSDVLLFQYLQVPGSSLASCTQLVIINILQPLSW